jgi:hypothetical protein
LENGIMGKIILHTHMNGLFGTGSIAAKCLRGLVRDDRPDEIWVQRAHVQTTLGQSARQVGKFVPKEMMRGGETRSPEQREEKLIQNVRNEMGGESEDEWMDELPVEAFGDFDLS